MREDPYIKVAQKVIAGGVKILQPNEKEMSDRELINIGLELRELTREKNVKLIINDRVDIALAVEADGMHVGQGDIPAREARKLLGDDKILGVSVTCVREALQAQDDGADYVNVNQIAPGFTKRSPTGAYAGFELITQVKAAVDIPVTASSGIRLSNVADYIKAGADGAVICFTILTAENITEMTKRYIQIVTETKEAMLAGDRDESSQL